MISTCVNQGDHLWIEVTASYSFKRLIVTIHEVAEHCQREKLNKVLIDLRNMNGNPNTFERYLLGLEIARTWGPQIRAAILVRPEISSRMTENTAVNRGAQIRVKSRLDEALEWLEIKKEQEHA